MYIPDELDRKIMRELGNDARSSLRKLSRKLEISITTISNRISRMERSGIIKGYSVLLNPENLGIDLTAIIELNVSKGKSIEVEQDIARAKNVFAIYNITGESDVILMGRFKKRNELSKFIRSLKAKKYVEKTNTHVVLHVVKEDLRLEL